MADEEKFNYCIGFYWGAGHGNHIGCYTYFGEVHHGTMQDAEGFLKYVMTRPLDKGEVRKDYRIFKVVEL